MLQSDALKIIERDAVIAHRWPKYTVVLDNTKNNDVDAADLKDSDYTVIYTGKNYDKAVEITNFWDERQNVHLVVNDVEKIRTEFELSKILVANDLTVPVDHALRAKFENLSTTDLINIMSIAAKNRIAAS